MARGWIRQEVQGQCEWRCVANARPRRRVTAEQQNFEERIADDDAGVERAPRASENGVFRGAGGWLGPKAG